MVSGCCAARDQTIPLVSMTGKEVGVVFLPGPTSVATGTVISVQNGTQKLILKIHRNHGMEQTASHNNIIMLESVVTVLCVHHHEEQE